MNYIFGIIVLLAAVLILAMYPVIGFLAEIAK